MAKRKNGEGSWGTKTIKGTKYKYYRQTYDGFGDKYFYGKTDTEINEKRAAFEEEYNAKKRQELIFSNPTKSTVTFGEYIEKWLVSEKTLVLSQGVYDGYETAIRCRIKELKEYDLYNKQMAQIDESPQAGKQIFSDYINALVEHGYALKTIKEVKEIISQCLDYASSPTRLDLKYNYLSFVTMPTEQAVKKKRREIHFMKESEMETLYNECKRINEKGKCKGGRGIGKPTYGNNAYAMIILLYTGLRIGELCALKWCDIDLENRTMFVHRSLCLIKNRDKKSEDDGLPKNVYIEKDTKTKNGRRVLSITNRVMDSLLYFKQFKTSEDGFVCVSSNLTHLNRHGMSHTLERMLKNAELKKYSLHELRHSFGSVLLEKSDNQDRAIAAISRILGHANITITYNIYIHILDERLTTTFKMLDYDDVKKAFEGDDILDDDMDTTDASQTQPVPILSEDGVNYKEKYEQLLKAYEELSAAMKTIQNLLPSALG